MIKKPVYLVVSDIHGSLEGLERLKAAMERENPDCLLLLGDLLRGASDGDSYKVGRYLGGKKFIIRAVLGNCDFESDEEFLGFPLTEEDRININGRMAHLSHKPDPSFYPAGDIVMNGHTHVKDLRYIEGTIYLNPGSISLPRDGLASYAVITPNRISLKSAIDGTEIDYLEI